MAVLFVGAFAFPFAVDANKVLITTIGMHSNDTLLRACLHDVGTFPWLVRYYAGAVYGA